MARNGTSRVALERIVAIARLLRAGEAFNCASVAEHFEVCHGTVKRDVAYLRDRLRWDFEWDAARNSYVLRRAPEAVLL